MCRNSSAWSPPPRTSPWSSRICSRKTGAPIWDKARRGYPEFIFKKASVIQMEAKPSGGIASHMKEVIRALGENPEREGLVRTPDRCEKALRYLTSGYSANVQDIVNGALFDVKYDEV